ncbi:MAG: hypothetical protein ACR2RB_15285 [Gammaproteobacteria bacterium]
MSANDANGRRRWRLSFLFVLAASTSVAIAGPREQAKRIHNRLTGTHPSPAVLSSMAAKITAGDALGAANEAIDNPAFYNTTLKDLATPWSTKRQSIFVGLNDLSATVIGLIRDNRSFQEVLTADVLYVGAAGVVPTPYSHTDNTHYQELEANGVDLSNPANLVPVAQSTIPDTPLTPENTAGIMTSRTFAEAFFAGGTNRRATRFASINFLCGDMEAFRDITRPADRIRPDITRSPGGDSSIFLNDCISCHSGMDALTGAFAYYDFSKDLQRLVFTDNVAQAKNNKAGTTFPLGFITTDDSWVNYWRVGVNSGLGWNPVLPDRGKGAKSLGVEITSSRAFAECQVSQVLAKVCLREPTGAADSAAVQRIADVFQAGGYNMKTAFAEAAIHCMGN